MEMMFLTIPAVAQETSVHGERRGMLFMARQIPVSETLSEERSLSERSGDVRLGIGIELATLLWMVLEAGVALAVGVLTRSVSLQGFGLDSVVELVSGSILLWRLLVEARGGSLERIERAERRAAGITASGLFLLALFLVLDSTFTLFFQIKPEASWWGVGLAVAAALIMPLLWLGKLRVARRIGSAALRADAACSLTCAWMSLALLLGLMLNRVVGWWWADPLAALALVYFLLQEGREALHEARTGEACHCGDESCAVDE